MINIHSYRFGVNYTPSEHWWYCWNDFKLDSIERDLDLIASLGADHIRIMAIWPYFQPNPQWVSPAHLDHLSQLMSAADDRNLDVCVTMLNGHLTGQNFRQGYEKNRSFFSNPELLAAQRLYFEQVSAAITQHRNFLGFDLGNELNCCWKTNDLDEGDCWFYKTMDMAEELAPNAIHVNGVDHAPWFAPHTFSPRSLAKRQSIVALHCWIYFTGALAHGGPNSELVIRLIDAMVALARAYALDACKPVWVQEYGASEEWMEAPLIPGFLEKTTLSAIRNGVAWFTWWASHDIDQKFAVNSLEYSLGSDHLRPNHQVARQGIP